MHLKSIQKTLTSRIGTNTPTHILPKGMERIKIIKEVIITKNIELIPIQINEEDENE